MVGRDHAARFHDGSSPPVAPDAVTALDQRFDADGLYALRAAVAAHAAQLGAGEETVEELVVIANELATNAIRHGGGAGRLRLWRDGPVIRCEVSDGGPGVDPAAGHERAPLTAYGGRGLWVVRQMSRDVDVTTGPRGATVTAAIPIDR
ncbi:ATP-binding protein [Phytohabitans rumicis]|uniref:Histidine kinase/HSP90-like ATPase domain-containing protein n=1 Tax=Phytohabitans rumicis TaxID=1076125 RepID=A0A6V8LJN2_9ACTN|nr:ATP-binding protein [Phytohabitans rumicis]GFJ94386.1 hypothetical protein Prum_080280 [Phytohabitans rumicis]